MGITQGRKSAIRLKTFELAIQITKVKDGGDYPCTATSPELPNLLVVGDTADEVLTLAPRVASALIASMKASGDVIPIKSRRHSKSQTVKHISAKA